jgi:lipopolysaccharide biosynthesis regulator YciM
MGHSPATLFLAGAVGALFSLALAWLLRGRHERQVERISDPYADALRMLADGKGGDAFVKLQQAVIAGSAPPDAYVRIGRMLRERGDAERALQVHRSLTVKSDLTHRERVDIFANVAEDLLALSQPERALRTTQQQISSAISESLSAALEEFNRGVAQASHRHLTNLLEEAQSLTREATAHLESNVAEARATVQTAASEALGEFRRQAEIHATVTATDTTQRVTSALAALDAEHRTVCDNRRKAIESDVARSTEQITEQFRQGLRAFFYSCLVAAVGAVEQHSQTTREGFVLDPKNFLPPEIK